MIHDELRDLAIQVEKTELALQELCLKATESNDYVLDPVVWEAFKTDQSKLYSRLCTVTWRFQEMERLGEEPIAPEITARMEDLVLLWAARLERTPPDWVLSCMH